MHFMRMHIHYMYIISTGLTRRRSAADLGATPSFHRLLSRPVTPGDPLGPLGTSWGPLGTPWRSLATPGTPLDTVGHSSGIPRGALGNLRGRLGIPWGRLGELFGTT